MTNSGLLKTTALATLLGLSAISSASSQEPAAQGEQDLPSAGKPTELDLITITATLGWQAVIDALSATSVVSPGNLERLQATTAADLFRHTPGVSATMSGDDPATAINIRGLQQYGRVAVTLDGARQDFWRVGHGSGSFFIEPELLKQVTVIRGPVSNAFGTGAIGGVVAFETKAARDFLRDGETWALSEKLRYESNGSGWLSSTTGAYQFNENFDVIGNLVYRSSEEYKDGNGDTVRWTGEDGLSGYGKVTLRPADGHELQLGASIQNYDDIISGSSGSSSSTLSRYDTDTLVENYTGRYTYNPDENDLWDLTFNVYHSATRSDQYRVWPSSRIGETRYYDVSTTGFNVRNTSRFAAWGMEHALTYGGDYSHLRGDSDADHFGQGTQDAYGAFLQWEGNYDQWLDLTAALRYDGYRLDGHSKPTPTIPSQDVSLTGDRWSPRFTVGVTPFEGIQFYGTYAEGYRTPHLQDVFRQNGAHGSGYEPNLLLRPEVASTWEAGVNLKLDSIFTADDMLRAKVNVFHSDVDDYIEVVAGSVRQAQNVGTARLRGVELEGIYDYGFGFINLAASFTEAELKDGPFAGDTLSNTPLDNVAVTLGFRALDDRLTYGVQYQSIGEVVRELSSSTRVYPRVDLVNLFANWDVNENLRVDFGVDNLFDKAYTDPQSGWSSTSDIEQGKGRTFKIAVTGRIGG
ncbi:hemoglobin/transferrin/lactoferrin receptor protein [Nitratireductor aquibiodomus]|uniref:Hemoglobin/transferrin/lactoferrin receptor protein n=1 Tax=Nitratireductor aquibiodomus TaxID=204799 RepID=A0A1H4LRS7_9HYPH|nr:TonB-dependent hemoglobin/transferrin/lactoferrin family receptor [Nitratireductor aquibiodomus]SEB73449.1 hemoglobin/transferrin/lactoferrin receptor protein [Nitratireductor aquibiodomus]